MSNHLRTEVTHRILDAPSISQKKRLFMQFKGLFVQKITDEKGFFAEFGGIRQLKDTPTLLADHRDQLLRIDKSLLPLQSKLNDEINRALSICAPSYPCLFTHEMHGDAVCEYQLEQEKQNEKEHQQEVALEISGLKARPHIPWINHPLQQFYLTVFGFLSLNKIISTCGNPASFFGEVYARSNYYQTYDYQKNYLDEFLKPVHALLFRKFGSKQLDCCILSQQEAQELSPRIENGAKDNHYVWICNTSMTLLSGTPPPDIKKHSEYQSLIEQVRFFAGEFQLLLKGDIPLKWLANDSENKLAFFSKNLLPYRETENSDVKKLSDVLKINNSFWEWIAANPQMNYRDSFWQDQLIAQLSLKQYKISEYTYLLKAYDLAYIAEMMTHQSSATLIDFLIKNQFHVQATQTLATMKQIDKTSCKKITKALSSIKECSPEVKKILLNNTSFLQSFLIPTLMFCNLGFLLYALLMSSLPLMFVSALIFVLILGAENFEIPKLCF
jgi:hypothetical protein